MNHPLRRRQVDGWRVVGPALELRWVRSQRGTCLRCPSSTKHTGTATSVPWCVTVTSHSEKPILSTAAEGLQPREGPVLQPLLMTHGSRAGRPPTRRSAVWSRSPWECDPHSCAGSVYIYILVYVCMIEKYRCSVWMCLFVCLFGEFTQKQQDGFFDRTLLLWTRTEPGEDCLFLCWESWQRADSPAWGGFSLNSSASFPRTDSGGSVYLLGNSFPFWFISTLLQVACLWAKKQPNTNKMRNETK